MTIIHKFWRDLMKNPSSYELMQIQGVLLQSASNLSLVELESLLNKPIPKRSLQRALSQLVEQGLVQREGKGRATRYRAITLNANAEIKPTELKFSQESQNIINYVTQPLSKRQKVNYQPNLLERYEPNNTQYLSEKSITYLTMIGTQPGQSQISGTFAKSIYNQLIIDLSWNSSRLEGNTYSLIETKQLLDTGKPIAGRSIEDTTMILNHKNAIEFLVENSDIIDFNNFTICNLHACLADKLLSNPRAYGQVRNLVVGIQGSCYQPLNIPTQLEFYFTMILEKAREINDPFETAFFVMVHLPYLQAFEDVNKRTSRLAANISLIKNNLCPIAFIDLNERDYINAMLGVYELNKTELLEDVFVWAYQRSALYYSRIKKTIGEPNALALKYHTEITQLIVSIVTQQQDPRSAAQSIQQWAENNLPKEHRRQFITITENELLALHSGNIARFKITLEQFNAWQKKWA